MGITEVKDNSLPLPHFPGRVEIVIFPSRNGRMRSQSFPYFLEYQKKHPCLHFREENVTYYIVTRLILVIKASLLEGKVFKGLGLHGGVDWKGLMGGKQRT